MNTKRRKSKQREMIYTIIESTDTHPTALTVYDELRKEMPTVSMGNVYRNIKILIEEKRIECREFGDGVEHYDAITELHYHFVCKKCNTISDFNIPVQKEVIEIAQKATKNTITGHTIQFYGICENCKNIK